MKPNYRRCVSCRQIAPKEAFWRIVRVYPTRTVQLDKGMGRSAYLCPRADCLKAAQKKNRLGRSLRTAVPKDVYDQLWQRLTKPSTNTALANSHPEDPALKSQHLPR
ncbi:MAG: YlxR family protein [Cyanobacteria bacterium J06626_18]